MNWEERVNDSSAPSPQQLQDQVTILQSQLHAASEENRRLRSLGETDIKEMVDRALTKFETALVAIRMALNAAKIEVKEPSDERAGTGSTGKPKTGKRVQPKSTDSVSARGTASGEHPGQVPVREAAGVRGLRKEPGAGTSGPGSLPN